MRVHRIATGRRLPPFDDAPGDWFVSPRGLGEAQRRLCQLRGLELVDHPADAPLQLGPGLVLFDDCYLDGAALDLLQQAAAGTEWALSLGDDPLGRFLELADPAGRVSWPRPVGAFHLAAPLRASDPTTLWAQLETRCTPLPLPPCPSRRERLPGFPDRPAELEIPCAGAIALRVRHWAQLLWLNQAIAYAAPSGRRDRRGNAIDPQARIHPSALLERTVVGPRSVVEAHASLIDCAIGADVRIGDHSSLVGCVLGDGCLTLADSMFRRVVSWPHSTLSSLGLEELLIGRGAFLTTAAIFFPTRLGETAAIELDGARLDSGRARLGGCVGHGVVLGARAVFEPAQVVPGGYTVVMRPEEGVGWIDPRLADGRPACWDRGKLLPLTQVDPDHVPPELD